MPKPETKVETFTPLKRTIAEILSSTSPSIRVPDFQRDYSWESEQVSEFWEDLVDFAGTDTSTRPFGKEYFLGATVMVNNGNYHLLLDGQQRLATSTILLAAFRDKIDTFQKNAAGQLNELFICFQDHMSGQKVYKLELNLDDRQFFRELIQTYPRVHRPTPKGKSHIRIEKAYDFFSKQIEEAWAKAGGGQAGFDWAVHITMTLRDHMALVAVISTDEKAAGSIFTSLNDRGVGLSIADLIRSQILQMANLADREAIQQYWQNIFQSCGTDFQPESLIRMAWVSRHGDVKARALNKVILGSLKAPVDALSYSQQLETDAIISNAIRTAEPSNDPLETLWHYVGIFKFKATYPLLMSAARMLSTTDQIQIVRALISLIVRRNVVADLDRASFESLLFGLAKSVHDGADRDSVVAKLKSLSPSTQTFREGFMQLSLGPSESATIRYMLRELERTLWDVAEFEVAGPDFVHIEHIYPQRPPEADRWADHADRVYSFGNLTLLAKKINQAAKNSGFEKKRPLYKESGIRLNAYFELITDWNASAVEARNEVLLTIAEQVWPEQLIP